MERTKDGDKGWKGSEVVNSYTVLHLSSIHRANQ